MNSYHLLLCCLDLLFSNALYAKNRRELLNPKFEGTPSQLTSFNLISILYDLLFKLKTINGRGTRIEVMLYIFFILCKGLPQDFGNRDFKVPAEVPCIVESLCNRHQGTITLDFFFLVYFTPA